MNSNAPRPLFDATPPAKVDVLRLDGTQAANMVPSAVPGGFKLSEEAISNLGHQPMERVAHASEKLLTLTKSGDVGAMGDRLGDLVLVAKGIDPGSLGGQGLFRRLFGGVRAARERFLAQYRSVSSQVDKLVAELDRHATNQKERIATLETLYSETEKEYVELGGAIVQGDAMLSAVKAQAVPAEPADPLAAQRSADARSLVQRLEKRVHDLKIAQALALQTAPQIRLMQENARMLVAKFDDLNHVTIPAWKKQFSLQILMLEQESAAKVVNAVDEATNEAIRRNAELLKQNAGTIAQAGSRSLVDIATLQHSQQQLLEGIGEVRRITDEARSKRALEEGQLQELQKNLLAALKK